MRVFPMPGQVALVYAHLEATTALTPLDSPVLPAVLTSAVAELDLLPGQLPQQVAEVVGRDDVHALPLPSVAREFFDVAQPVVGVAGVVGERSVVPPAQLIQLAGQLEGNDV